ncbi:MAG: phosphoribosylglycinamide formyltransferase [Syntrophobacteria bacterium]
MRAARKRIKLAVLLSGSGTNLQAMVDGIEAGKLDATIALVLSNNPDAYGLTRAREHGIPTAVVDYREYSKKRLPEIPDTVPSRKIQEVLERQRIYSGLHPEELRDRLARLLLAEQELIALLDPVAPDLICLAGFMRLLSPFFISHYNQGLEYRIMNIHPALLPAFPGSRGYEETFGYGCRFGGITVHFVDEGEDTGPIVAQAVYPIWPEDTLEAVRDRGLQLEYVLYSQCIQWVARGDLQMESSGDGRTRVRILDPGYPRFIEDLLRQAFGM